MGFFSRFFGGGDSIETREISICEIKNLFDAAADYTARKLAFYVCVNMVANALGLCEFKTYQGGKETKRGIYWTWNYEPGINENRSIFLHKLVDRLYSTNNALIVPTRMADGLERFAVADDWELPESQVTRENEYRAVRVDDMVFRKTFRESEVLRLKLNATAMEPVIRLLGQSWNDMVNAARRNYAWDKGKHWKVHIDQMASGADSFDANFARMIQEQVKPFLESDAAILPEFDGYKYEEVVSSGSSTATADLRTLVEDIFNLTAMGFGIPAVLVNGKVESTKDANSRFLTYVIDPLATQLQEEITRKVYGFEDWSRGDYLVVDTSTILHYDLFAEAANFEKLVGSGGFSINDLRTATGQATINEPWADKHYLTLNIKPIEQVAAPAEDA